MATYKTGRGRGTKTVEARQLVGALDYDVADFAGGAMFQDARRSPEIRIYRPSGDSADYVTAHRYDWVVKLPDGQIIIESPESFRDHYREVKEEEK